MGVKFVIILTFLIAIENVLAQQRIRNMIYTSLKQFNPCYRRLNGTNQVGCGTSEDGQYGVLHLVESEVELQWVIQDGPHAPYVALLPLSNFTENVLQTLIQHAPRVAGLLVIHNVTFDKASKASPDKLSFDTKCPAERYSLYANQSTWANCRTGNWNPPGNSLLFTDIPFPIFLLTSTGEITSLVDAYRRKNQPVTSDGVRTPPSYPLVSVELTSTMYAFQSTQTCMRRNNLGQRAFLSPQSFCERVAARSSICTLKPPSNTTAQSARTNRSVVLVVSTVDAETPFFSALTGARQFVSFATLLGVANTLGSFKQLILANDSARDVALVAFYGEALDRGASQRFAYDLARGQALGAAPILWEHIHSVIEIGQVAEPDTDSNANVYYAHSDPLSRAADPDLNTTVASLVAYLAAAARLNNIIVRQAQEYSSQPLPPSSIQSLLREARPPLPAVLVSDHRTEFRNPFFQSTLDTAATLDYEPFDGTDYSPLVERVTSLVTTVARTVFATALGCQPDDARILAISANRTELDYLLGCLLLNASCELMQLATSIDLPSQPPVFLFSNAISFSRKFQTVPQQLLGWYMGDQFTNISNASDCAALASARPPYTSVWTRRNCCVLALSQSMDSTSPAFIISGYDFKSYQYAAWTESIWGQDWSSVRIFMQPSSTYQAVVLIVGIILTLFAGGLSWWIVAHASHILILSTQADLSPSASSPLEGHEPASMYTSAGPTPASTHVAT